MIEFLGYSFFASYLLLREASDYMELCAGVKKTPLGTSGEGRGKPLELGPAVELTKDQRQWIAHLTESAQQASEAIGLSDCALLAGELHRRLKGPQSCTYDRAQSELGSILTLMSVGLSKQRFAFVPLENQPFFEDDNLLEIASPSPLPEADQDTRAAGNCLALDLHTAAVFHLMRVAEHGVRRLITDFQIRIPSRPCLEDADWSELINGLNAKVVALSTPSPKRGSQEQKEVERLTILISEARTLRNFRNPTMHCRVVYNVHEAKNILVHVRTFIQRVLA